MFRKRKYCDEEKQNDEDKLKKAVRNGDEKMVRRLVKGGVLLNSKSRRDWVWKSKMVPCQLVPFPTRTLPTRTQFFTNSYLHYFTHN